MRARRPPVAFAPLIAQRGLDAQRYAKLAPDGPRAQHMPSHTVGRSRRPPAAQGDSDPQSHTTEAKPCR
jgi:hypothetical protein